MIELQEIFKNIDARIAPVALDLGFSPDIPEGAARGTLPVYYRGENNGYLQYAGPKGKIRVLFNENKIRLLTAEPGADESDDSAFALVASFLMIPEEYDQRDVRSCCNELEENIREAYTPKQIAKRQRNVKAQATVTRSQVKSGALLYDPATLAIKLAALYPEIKDAYTAHLQTYDEFLCEDFFINHVNDNVYQTIVSGDKNKLKRLFNIINEVYLDGSNEVQDVIVVTMLSAFEYTDAQYQMILEYMDDLLMEQFIRVNNYLKKSKSARMRLENPPKYKPKKQKKRGGLMDMLSGGGGGLQQ